MPSRTSDLARATTSVVSFRCLRCGQVTDRPATYVARTYGAATLAEVGERARCLRYVQGKRCGGRAAVEFAPLMLKPPPGGTHSRAATEADFRRPLAA